MGNILGTWRGAFTSIFHVVIVIGIITMMNHANFSKDAKEIRTNISHSIASELIKDENERADFMKMINDPEVFQEKGSQSAVIMRYPNYLKEANSKKYAEKANEISKALNLKFAFGNLIYDNISDLEKAYETVKKLY